MHASVREPPPTETCTHTQTHTHMQVWMHRPPSTHTCMSRRDITTYKSLPSLSLLSLVPVHLLCVYYYKRSRPVPGPPSLPHTRACTLQSPPHVHTRACTHTHTLSLTHARTHTHTHAHTHVHIHIHTQID